MRCLGSSLAEFVKSRPVDQLTTASLQAVISDLAVDHVNLIAPLKDLVSRKSFQSLIPSASSGGCGIQRDTLIQEISRVYHPAILKSIEDVLNGFLESSGGVALQLSQSIFLQNQSSSTEASNNTVIANPLPDIASSRLTSEGIQSPNLSVSHRYFDAAIEIAKIQEGANLQSASVNTSGKGIFGYVIRDSSGTDLARVPIAMLDAKLRSTTFAVPTHESGICVSQPSEGTDPLFLKAVKLARRMGNTNLAESSATYSSKGFVNYTIRDSMSNILAKVPLSMLQNA